MSTQTAKYDQTLIQLLTGASKNLRDQTAKLVAADRADETDSPNLAAFLRWVAKQKVSTIHRKILFTGSQVYGTPTAESDVDWVMTVDPDIRNYLIESFADEICGDYGYITKDTGYYAAGFTDEAFRMGPLNIICISTRAQLHTWGHTTRWLTNQAPVQRDVACDLFYQNYVQAVTAGWNRPLHPRRMSNWLDLPDRAALCLRICDCGNRFDTRTSRYCTKC